MNNNIRGRNSKEVKIQLKRAEVQKNLIIKNIYKEYEIYFKIVRKSIISSAEKGIFYLCNNLSINECDKSLNTRELVTFLNQNIIFLINSKLPFLTIEQLKLGDFCDPQNQLVNRKDFNELLEFKEYQEVDFDDENELISKESFEFHCNNHPNLYEYYGILREDEFSSVNLDTNFYLDSFSKQNNIKNINYEKHNDDAVLEIIEETKSNKLTHHENLKDQVNDFFNPSDNLNIFETIDKSFSHLLFNISYSINSELFKTNLIKKTLTEDKFSFLSNKNNIIQHPYPFVIRYISKQKNLSDYGNKYSDIYLLNISNVELEFYNLELSIRRNNINELKNRLRLLNRKEQYWKSKKVKLS